MEAAVSLPANLNSNQQRIVDQIIVDYNNKKLILATISGAAGTGKTFTVNKLKKHIGKVATIAPTNSAAKLIGGYTIHKYFQMRPIDPDAPVIEFSKTLSVDPELVADTIILDECSMVKNSVIGMIVEYCQDNNVNLICVGDEYQLPPVDNDEDDEGSPTNWCFNDQLFQQYKLTEIVRQAKDNTIIKFSANYRQYEHIPNMVSLVGYGNKNIINDIFQRKGMAYFDDDTTILGFSNSSVMDANKLVVDMKYGDGVLFRCGDTVILKKPIWYKAGEYYDKETASTQPTFAQLSTGEELSLVSCNKTIETFFDIDNCKYRLSGFLVQIAVGELTLQKFLLHYDSVIEYQELCKTFAKEWANKYSKLSKETIKLKWQLSKLGTVMFAYHKYASTIHLSQGRTFKKVMLMTNTLYRAYCDNDIQLYNRLMYVAATRPSDSLILTGKIV